MKIKNGEGCKRITIEPGEYYVSSEDVVMTTLLGSCVSSCLYDPYTRITGMNHFLLSSRRYAKDMPLCITDAGRYGIHSMELLINEMWKCGARRENLKAKVFGGGAILKTNEAFRSNFFSVGEVNVRFIREFLKNENIPLVASDLGGTVGRVISFYSRDYSVYVRKMAATGAGLLKREKRYWERSIKRQEETDTQIDLW